MATCYWYMMSGNWSDSTKWMGGAVPTASDDVVLQGGSACTITANAACRSLDANSYTGTLTHNASVTLSIGDATAGASNIALRLGSSMTYTLGSATTSAISFVSSSATQQSITTNGKTLGNVIFNHSSGSWVLGDSLTTSGSWTFTAGAWSSGGFNIISTGTNATFAGGGKTYSGTVSLTGSGAVSCTGSNIFTNFTRIGTAAKTDSLLLGSSQTLSGTLTLTGNSKINRLLVYSSTPGTAITLTCNGTVAANGCDLSDITGAGSASWDLSSASNYTGNALGNTGISFTEAAAQAWSGTLGGNWSANAWSGRVPLPQDNSAITSSFSSQTITIDMPRLAKDISFAGVSGTVAIARSTAASMYGSLTLASGVTMSGSSNLTLAGRSSHLITKSSATVSSTGSMILNSYSGTYTFQDAWSQSGTLNLSTGTMDLNGNSVTALTFSSSNSSTRAIIFGSGMLTVTHSSSPWVTSTTSGLTVTPGTGVISLTSTATTVTFAGGGTWPELRAVTAANSTLVITGVNTLIRISTTGGLAKTIRLPGSVTTTLTGTTPFPGGTAGNLLTFTASSGSATVSCANAVDANYISLTNIVGSGAGIPLYAGPNSTDGGGNTNWTFTSRPSGGQQTSNMLMLF